MPTFSLRDVDVTAISLVKQGANGQRIFLCKTKADAPTIKAGHQRIVVKSDWSTFYIVVAEPDRPENGGIFAPDVTDVWTADEIAKAAHRFMANGGVINKEHEDILLGTELAPYGTLVENAVALADFSVQTPDGPAVITKGSWYIGVQPTDDGKAAIEAGEFGGVSIQGTAARDPISKADEDSLVARLGAWIEERFGLTPKEPVVKAVDDFSTRQFKSDLTWELDEAVWNLSDVIWAALHREDVPDPASLINTSVDQFAAWVKAEVANFPGGAEALAKRLELAKRLPTGATLPADHDLPQEDEMDADTKQALEDLQKHTDEEIGKVTSALGEITSTLGEVAKRLPEPEAKPPTAEELRDAIGKVAGDVGKIAKAVEALGEGTSTQEPSGGLEPNLIAKNGQPHALSGLLD